jgi:hypothetical protein
MTTNTNTTINNMPVTPTTPHPTSFGFNSLTVKKKK